MEQNNTITIAVWLEKSQSLLNKIEKLFKEIDVDTSDLPKSAYDSNNPISLVFAGQYSAGIAYKGNYRVFAMGFPFESIESETDRAIVMAAILKFFGEK